MSRGSKRELLYHSPSTTGGLAAYAHEQACALAEAGCAVTLATRADYPQRKEAPYSIVRLHPALSAVPRSLPPSARRLNTLWRFCTEQLRLTAYVEEKDFRHVLIGSYIEYAAPLWAWRFRRLARRGRIFGAVVHDPVRDYVVGPQWWHRLSIASGYSFLRHAFVHAPIALDTVRPMSQLRITVIPQGPYRYPPSQRPAALTRKALNLPADVPVLLAFGHLRDEKNLHLTLEAMAAFPELHLIVAGKEQTDRCRPGSYYQEQARRRGVADRCRWMLRYVAAEEVGGLFEASDVILLTYGRSYRSASGVLNTAMTFRKPCLASSGEGNLKQVVQKYGLGIWIEPDDAGAIRAGLRALLAAAPDARWEEYQREHGWDVNAKRVIESLFSA